MSLLMAVDDLFERLAGPSKSLSIRGHEPNRSHKATQEQFAGLEKVRIQGHGAALRGAAQKDTMPLAVQTLHLGVDQMRQAVTSLFQGREIADFVAAPSDIAVPRGLFITPGLPHDFCIRQHSPQARPTLLPGPGEFPTIFQVLRGVAGTAMQVDQSTLVLVTRERIYDLSTLQDLLGHIFLVLGCHILSRLGLDGATEHGQRP
mmetsp:Transcript_35349/g.76451  ORF Transcript_35349/g.76451 Transcript_35349/m.76451 type:complete len:204 (-) Transcript_35349:99-710(-)